MCCNANRRVTQSRRRGEERNKRERGRWCIQVLRREQKGDNRGDARRRGGEASVIAGGW